MLLRNPKKPEETIETDLSEEQALTLLKAVPGDFSQSLVQKYPHFSPSQWYWFFKLAHEQKGAQPIKLASDLEAFCRKFPKLYLKVGDIPGIGHLGEITFAPSASCVSVYSGYRKAGEIKGDEYFPRFDSPKLLAQVQVFAEQPVAFLELFGKLTGCCCICGRMLTNEVSVERGIGPICAEKYGI